MFRNKHIIAALIITPILAVIAYFGVDNLVGEKPHKAEPGQSYALAALPQCRYTSGHCTLKNADFKVEITPVTVGADNLVLKLHSAFPLQSARMALVQDVSQPGNPVIMQPLDEKGLDWQVALSGAHTEHTLLRLVLNADQALYYGETGVAFLTYATSFGGTAQSN